MRREPRVRARRRCALPSRTQRYSGGAWLPRPLNEAYERRLLKLLRRGSQRKAWRALVHLYTCRPLGRRRPF